MTEANLNGEILQLVVLNDRRPVSWAEQNGNMAHAKTRAQLAF